MNGAGWVVRARSAALFAAAAAILAKIGLRDVDPDFATLIRTIVILAVLGVFVAFTGKWSNPLALDTRALTLLRLSGLATGASWVSYFRAQRLGDVAIVALGGQTQRGARRRVRGGLPRRDTFMARDARSRPFRHRRVVARAETLNAGSRATTVFRHRRCNRGARFRRQLT